MPKTAKTSYEYACDACPVVETVSDGWPTGWYTVSILRGQPGNNLPDTQEYILCPKCGAAVRRDLINRVYDQTMKRTGKDPREQKTGIIIKQGGELS